MAANRPPPARPPTKAESPKMIYKKAYLNLDALFDDVFYKLTGEPITPNKIAIIYLLRILFETHFGHLHNRSDLPMFTAEEKQRIFEWIFALMTSEKELSYEEFRRVCRGLFGDDRMINVNFVALMEKLGSGETDVNLMIEDEFFTNKHPRIPLIDWNAYHENVHEMLEEAEKYDLKFTSMQSFVMNWVKKIQSQYFKANQTELFDMNQRMRDWIHAIPQKSSDPVIPYSINCSMRARAWIAKNIRFIENNPHYADPFPLILENMKLVQKKQPDVVEAYLLESMVYIQMKDAASATKAMKKFFEWSMFELSNDMKHCRKTFRLGIPTQTPLMYAPIMEARICRLFGDFTRARLLLRESIQQAQLRIDEVCHQMGNTDLHTVDIIGCEAILEDRAGKSPANADKDPRVLRKPLKHIDDVAGHSRKGPCCSQIEADFELVAEMGSYGKMLMLLKGIAEGTYQLKYTRKNIECGISCPLGTDLEERGRKVSDYGHAIMTSNMIRNGMFDQAATTATEMITGNVGIDPSDCFQTESYAVATVNLAYAKSANGDFEEALEIIKTGHESFPDNLSWQSNRHFVIAETIIDFEQSFLINEYEHCLEVIGGLAAYSDIEYKLRLSILHSATGDYEEGIRFLKDLKIHDIRGRIRCCMQLASFYTANESYDMTLRELTEAQDLAEATTLLNVIPMIKRRMATMLLCKREYEDCLEIIEKIQDEIDHFGSFTERVCLYLTAARALRMLGKDSRNWLKRARQALRNNKWPTMEMMVLAEISEFHGPEGLVPDSQRLSQTAEQFEKLASQFSGRCDWLLI